MQISVRKHSQLPPTISANLPLPPSKVHLHNRIQRQKQMKSPLHFHIFGIDVSLRFQSLRKTLRLLPKQIQFAANDKCRRKIRHIHSSRRRGIFRYYIITGIEIGAQITFPRVTIADNVPNEMSTMMMTRRHVVGLDARSIVQHGIHQQLRHRQREDAGNVTTPFRLVEETLAQFGGETSPGAFSSHRYSNCRFVGSVVAIRITRTSISARMLAI
mmetsp:Transcript_9945/g.20590  ORF Transcript_9945/g.20590 Transcript_9945/m.20590 type:complete len:215 (+) Transcript_9945:158-802(+)